MANEDTSVVCDTHALVWYLTGPERLSQPATEALEAAVDSGIIVSKDGPDRLGHSNPQMTLGLYARSNQDADRAAADMVGERLRPRDSRPTVATPRLPTPHPPMNTLLTRENVVGATGLEPVTSAV